jgi:hypothetical protein
MSDLLEMLNESIVAAAFERNEITDMRLAERLIWERKSAAARIAELEAALRKFDFYLILDSDKDTDTLPVLIEHIRAAHAALEKK